MKGGLNRMKKGLSNIVATVLIVLLALAAVAIIWSFISPTLTDAGSEIELQQACLDIATKVEATECTVNYTANTAVVDVSSDSGEDLDLTIILSDGEETDIATASIGAYGTLTDESVTVSKVGIATDGDLISTETYTARVAATVTIDAESKTCDPTDAVTCINANA